MASGDIRHRTVETNGIRMHIAEQGEGPLVLLCHGFPESWYSWRHQLRGAGRRPAFTRSRPTCAATARPTGRRRSTSTRCCTWSATWSACSTRSARKHAVIAGHDWGAPVAWHAALLRPDRFRGVIGLSVPFRPRGPARPTTVMPQTDDAMFYQLYFQTPGVAEAEFERDPRAARCAACCIRARATRRAASGGSAWCRAGGGFLARTDRSRALPSWLTEADSTSTRRSSRAPAFAAGSTGTATSTATGSCWRRSPASRSTCRRCTSPATATSSSRSPAWTS